MILPALLLGSSFLLAFCTQQVQQQWSIPLPEERCKLNNKIYVNGIYIPTYVDNCTCILTGGKLGMFPNDTDCKMVAVGYDGEYANRAGKCQHGKCTLPIIPLGCAGVSPPQKKAGERPQLGCTYLCYSDSQGRVEFGYHTEGTPCMHYNNQSTVNTTCKRYGTEVLCREEEHNVKGC
ncbi:uncharacterized protein LOC142578012 [Dermacentor variabilis]|uniref:uncharacterized protein LOC142578012 n=1 Tax=Dermacentor variabilis TaxID=34621 RepID=UPI003F5B2596